MAKRLKKPVAPKRKANGYKMPAPISIGEVIVDNINKKKWRIGPSIGVGGFGEIYSACDENASPKKLQDYPFVVKIEPHENGPLFVEKNFYLKNANKDDITKYMKAKKLSSLGMPTYFGNGTHMYNGEKYRYLVLERYGRDLWSLFKECGQSFPPATVFLIGLQMIDVLEYIHDRGYVHADIKGANILLGLKKGTENQAYLVDFGLATRVSDKEYKPDPKSAHNGTIEYTSRDAHLGVPTMRGDLEILGYNMLQWLTGELPWEKSLKDPKQVQDQKEAFMKNVRININKLSRHVPDNLIQYFEYVNTIKPRQTPDYAKCRRFFEDYLKTEGKSQSSKLQFKQTTKDKQKTAAVPNSDMKSHEEVQQPPKRKRATKKVEKQEAPIKRVRKKKELAKDKADENDNPDYSIEIVPSLARRNIKRKSSEPSVLVNNIKKTKLAPKATPPLRKNYSTRSTQTSNEKGPMASLKQVSFDSPICAIINDSKTLKMAPADSSGDIFEDSFIIEEKKVKPRRKLLSQKETVVSRVVKKKVTTTKLKGKSWKDCSTITNGRSPPST